MRLLLKTSAVIGFLLAGPVFAQNAKNDIRGFVPGMSFAEAGQVVKAKGYSCNNFSREVIPYGIMCEGMTLWFSTVLDGAPLIAVNVEMRTTASAAEIVKSLSEQYSRSPTQAPSDSNPDFVWELGDGKALMFMPNARRVSLGDMHIANRDQQERFQRSRVPVPKL